jgi:hypothetical protein
MTAYITTLCYVEYLNRLWCFGPHVRLCYIAVCNLMK